MNSQKCSIELSLTMVKDALYLSCDTGKNKIHSSHLSRLLERRRVYYSSYTLHTSKYHKFLR